MIHRRIIFVLHFLIVSFLQSCSGNSEEDLGIDCTKSDLAIQVTSFLKSDCDVPGSIEVRAEGGEAPYEFSVDGDNFQESSTFENLFAGNFLILVRDNTGCTSSIAFTLESEPTGIALSLASSDSECLSSTGSITAEATGGVGELMFSLDGGKFSKTSSFNALASGKYDVTVKDEENCQVKKSIQVRTNTSLSGDIMPIIRKDCAISGCHNGSQSPRLISEEEVVKNAIRIKSETQAGTMPRNRSLTDSEIDLIACWVDDGATNN